MNPAFDDDSPATEPRPANFSAASFAPEAYEEWLEDEAPEESEEYEASAESDESDESDDEDSEDEEEIELPEPTDEVDAALQLAAVGEGPDEAVLEALVVATLYLEGVGDDIALYSDDDGNFIRVLTDPEHAGEDVTDVRIVSCADLVQLLPPGVVLEINPDSLISGRVSADELRALLSSGL